MALDPGSYTRAAQTPGQRHLFGKRLSGTRAMVSSKCAGLAAPSNLPTNLPGQNWGAATAT